MKKLLIIVGILLILGIGVAAYLVFNVSSIVTRYKPELERVASDALGSHVTLGKLSVSIFPSTSVGIDTLRVVGEGADGLTLKDLALDLKLMPLLKGNFQITTLSIDGPRIVLIKDASGVTIEGLPKKKAASNEQQHNQKIQEPKQASASPIAVSLEKFQVKNGTIVFRDTVENKEYSIQNLSVQTSLELGGDKVSIPSLSVKGKALDKADFSIDGDNIVFGLASGELTAGGLRVNTLGNSINILPSFNTQNSTGQAKITLSSLDITKFQPLVPALSSAPKEIRIDGALDVHISPAAIKSQTKDLGIVVNGQAIKVSFDSTLDQKNQTIAINPLQAQGFSGTVNGDFSSQLADQKNFSTNLGMEGIDLTKVIAIMPNPPSVKVTGTLQKLNLKLKGNLGPTLKESLSGPVDLAVKDGVIVGINIAGLVIRSVSSLPFLKAGGLYEAVPEKSKAAVDSPNTSIKSITGTFSLGSSALQTQNLNIVSDLFSLEAKGKVGFDSSLDLNATIYFEQEFSAGLAARAKGLQKVLDTQGRLVIPLAISGIPPKIIVLPNLEKLIEVGATRALQDGATKLLEKGLKGNKGLGKFLGF